ncbi:MAG: hypothetical protein ACRDIZ_01475 [Actinomycetota bacterium]
MPRRALAAVLTVAAVAVVGGVLLLRRDASEAPPSSPPTIERALAAFVRDRFGTRYVGTCPQEVPPDGDIPRGMCTARFSGTDGRAVYGVGPPFSEWVGEATLVLDPSGSWRVESFEEYPPLGTSSAPGSSSPTWDGPAPPDESGAISVAEFNRYLDDTALSWGDSPARIALEFLDLGDPSDPDQAASATAVLQEAAL